MGTRDGQFKMQSRWQFGPNNGWQVRACLCNGACARWPECGLSVAFMSHGQIKSVTFSRLIRIVADIHNDRLCRKNFLAHASTTAGTRHRKIPWMYPRLPVCWIKSGQLKICFSEWKRINFLKIRLTNYIKFTADTLMNTSKTFVLTILISLYLLRIGSINSECLESTRGSDCCGVSK